MLKVNVRGIEELKAKADYEATVQPAVGAMLTAFEQRIRQQGSGLGAQRNTLAVTRNGLARTIDTTLNWPRTKGTSWQRKNEDLVRAMAPNAEDRAVDDIERRWSS